MQAFPSANLRDGLLNQIVPKVGIKIFEPNQEPAFGTFAPKKSVPKVLSRYANVLKRQPSGRFAQPDRPEGWLQDTLTFPKASLRDVCPRAILRDGLRMRRPSGRLENGTIFDMPYRSNAFAQGQYYHLYNRGAGKGRIFFNAGNYEHLLQLIKRSYEKYGVRVIAYCLMPNHYHFLLRQETDSPLSTFIRVLFNSYVQAINIQQERTGALFEGRFKHKKVEKWEYLMVLCRYIHLNPVKASLVTRPEDWAYSNYREWIGLRDSVLVDKRFVRDHFSSPEEYMTFVGNVEDEIRSYENVRKYMFD